jgi:anti-sigma B factor antagonist
MFIITTTEQGEVLLSGRFDASQVEHADAVLNALQTTTRVNFADLVYISSAGIGILLKAQKRLTRSGNMLILTHMNKLVRDIFRIARLEIIFRIEEDA